MRKNYLDNLRKNYLDKSGLANKRANKKCLHLDKIKYISNLSKFEQIWANLTPWLITTASKPDNSLKYFNLRLSGLGLSLIGLKIDIFVLPSLVVLCRVEALQKLQKFILISIFLDSKLHPDVRNTNSRVEQVHNGLLLIHVVQELEVVEWQTFFCLNASFVDNQNPLVFQANLRRNCVKNITQPIVQVNFAHTVQYTDI
jgi:hypothetical protein